MRSSGGTGWKNETFGGGIYMYENDWIRTFGNKNFYHNTGVMRTDGEFQVGPNGNRLIVNGSGNVGINNITPRSRLDVKGELFVTGEDWNGTAIVTSKAGTAYFANNNYLNGISINSSGKVMIGTQNPTDNALLTVKGKIVASEIKVVAVTSMPDYVFKSDYKLMPLNEVEEFVNTNSRLPEVPSEKEFKENGVNLLEMNATLLKKVEELTLYLIQQEKRIKELEKNK